MGLGLLIEASQNRRTPIRIVAVLLLAAIPLLYQDNYFLHLMILSFIFGIVAASWDLTLGYSGVLNFAHVGFFGVGAYCSGILTISYGVSPWISMLIGGCLAAAASLVCGLPSLRLKGIYVVLFSFAFQQVIYQIVVYNPYDLTGGGLGLHPVPPLELGGINFGVGSKLPYYYFALILFLLSIWALRQVTNSSIGLAFIALRDDENYAIARGVNPYKYKTIAWVISTFFAGVMGGFYAHYMVAVTREILTFPITGSIISYLVVGGMGTIYGPIIGTFVLTFVSEYMRPLGGYRLIVVSIVMLLFLLFARGGIYQLIRSRLKSAVIPKRRRER